MIEIEVTYLAKEIPAGLESSDSKEIIDIYVPASAENPKLRLRKSGSKYEITKKELIGDDASHQKEYNITLTEAEFNAMKNVDGKKVHKLRYYYDFNGKTAEVDVFQGDLEGLVVIEFEFKTKEEKDSFPMPKFCLEDITQEIFIAGGMLCGKSYDDVKENLDRFGYKKLLIKKN